MTTVPPTPLVPIPAELLRGLYDRARAARWGLAEADFEQALARSVRSFAAGNPLGARECRRYLEALHLEDLALACACAKGRDEAWEHFVREFRPAILAAARSCAPPDAAQELADSIYADLFGLEVRDGVRRSLFDYFHGRSTLAGWLRAVLAQRVVDRARSERRLVPLDEAPATVEPHAEAPDVDRPHYVRLAHAALVAALDALAPRDRLRLSLYYSQQMKLAAIGRLLGESEATASRKLERTRRDIRAAIERRLREEHGLGEAQVAACFDYARTDEAFDLARALPPPDGP